MSWQTQLKGDSLTWLLEAESANVRYLAMRDLAGCPPDDPALGSAREQAYRDGPIADVLAGMAPAGYWIEPGPGYNPKYRSTIWALILLAQLGAHSTKDERITRACSYFLDQAMAAGGQISASGAPSGTADCMQGNLAWALVELGCTDSRLEQVYDWMARSVTGEGVAPMGDKASANRYYAGKCGPTFACGSNNKLPCAWGGAKVMLAFARWPKARWTPAVERAVQQGMDWFLGFDLPAANFPAGWAEKPSGNWWKFGFPVFYVTDLLQVAEALTALGHGSHPQMAGLLDLIRAKQDANGRWALEYDYAGKTWGEYGAKKQPNPWVTLRALRVLKAAWTD
jgi:hypothetical protein